jgi:hypothetical protein
MAKRKPKPHGHLKPPPAKPESPPEPTPAPLAAPVPPPLPAVLDEPPARQKAALRLLQRAVNEGWQIPDGVWAAAPRMAARLLVDPAASPRDRLRAAEVLSAMARDQINAAIALDKIERLEGGDATERVVITPEIRARAEEIIRRRFGNAG